MTKQEIQALIDAKIAGQGSAIDVGGALPTILHEILEMAAGGENVQSNWDETDNQSPQYIQNKPSIPAPYSLPIASAETLGGVIVGNNLSIDPETGVLSAQGGGGNIVLVKGSYNTDDHTFVCTDGPASLIDVVHGMENGTIYVFSYIAGDDEIPLICIPILADGDVCLISNSKTYTYVIDNWEY